MNRLIKFKKLLLLWFVMSLSVMATAQSKQIRDIIDTVITTFRTHSINASNVDWQKVQKTAYSKAKTIDSPLKLGDAIRYIYKAADDYHGSFYYGDSIFKLPYRGPKVSDSVTSEFNKGVTLKSAMLPDGIGYIRIPYISTDQKTVLDQKAQVINDSLCSLAKRDIRGMILDLRLNGGGNMHAMIAGLSSLLDTGLIGSFVPGERWFLRNNNVYIDSALQVSISSSCENLTEVPVVVIIGAATGSSGEFLAIALKGRKKTFFVGTATSGYVTAIRGFDLKEKGWMMISTAYGADRNGVIYKDAIVPDVEVDAPDSFNDLTNDAKVKAAVKWIESFD